jgi:ribonuclease VapC
VTDVVLDASALLAMPLDEPGASAVSHALKGAIISAVNLSEVIGHYARQGAAEADIRAMLTALPIEVEPFDEALAYQAGFMRPLGERVGLSLGDRSCLSLAKRHGARALTADQAWSKIAAAWGVEVQFIR